MDILPKVDKTAHAGSSRVPENVRELPLIESSVPLADVTDPLKLPTEVAPEVTYEKPKSRKKLGVIIGGAAAGLVIAGGAVFGITQANSSPEDTSKDTTEVTEDPGSVVSEAPIVNETEVPVEGEPSGIEIFGLPTVAELEVDSSLPDEEIARGFIEAFSSWNKAGANEETLDIRYSDYLDIGLDEYADLIADTIEDTFTGAIYGEYVNNPQVVDGIAKQVEFHGNLLEVNYQTYGVQNEEPFMQATEFAGLNEIVENSDGTTTYVVSAIAVNNGDKNISPADGQDIPVVIELTVDKSGSVAHLTTPPVPR